MAVAVKFREYTQFATVAPLRKARQDDYRGVSTHSHKYLSTAHLGLPKEYIVRSELDCHSHDSAGSSKVGRHVLADLPEETGKGEIYFA